MSDARDTTYVTLGGRACPVCRTPARAEIDLGGFELFHCPGCECWSSNALARQATMSWAPEAYFANLDADRGRWDDLLARIGAVSAPPRALLDVGCGAGGFLRYAAERFPAARLVGIELEAERAERARRAAPRAEVHAGDALEQLRRMDDRFDLITLWDVFEHVTTPAETLAALAERLTPEGVLFIQTIHEHSVVPAAGRASYRWSGGRVRFAARRTHDAHHLVFYSLSGLDRLAADADLRIVERWFDRLALARMDGSLPLKVATALVLSLENLFGNGLFVNLLLSRRG